MIKHAVRDSYLHEHRSQFDEVTMFRILHLNNTPRVHATSDPPWPDLNHRVWPNYSKRNRLLVDTNTRHDCESIKQLSLWLGLSQTVDTEHVT